VERALIATAFAVLATFTAGCQTNPPMDSQTAKLRSDLRADVPEAATRIIQDLDASLSLQKINTNPRGDMIQLSRDGHPSLGSWPRAADRAHNARYRFERLPDV
jgi:hypothetical protein